MKPRYLLSLALATLFLGPSAVQAQRAGRAASAPSFASGRRFSSMARSAPVRTTRRSGFVPAYGISSGYSAYGYGLTNLYPGTGLGINGINSILTQNNLGVEAAIDPATQLNLALTQRLLRGSGIFTGGGYYLLSGGGAYAVTEESVEGDQPLPQQAPQPQVIVLQQAPAQQSQLAEEPLAPALPDVGQFTLILQNGKQIQAIAFTHTNDRIVYITGDGSRRTIALSDLDTAATLRINEERGTPLQLPL